MASEKIIKDGVFVLIELLVLATSRKLRMAKATQPLLPRASDHR
jgi:hypothetical protein